MADPRYRNGVWQNRHRQQQETPVAYGWQMVSGPGFYGHTMYQWPDTDLFMCTTPPETGLTDDWLVFVDGEARATFSGPLHKITAGALELLQEPANV